MSPACGRGKHLNSGPVMHLALKLGAIVMHKRLNAHRSHLNLDLLISR